nr:MAG TPA: hypothetical protein [Bacteriophage sp.]
MKCPDFRWGFFIYFLFDNSLLALYFCRLTLIL